MFIPEAQCLEDLFTNLCWFKSRECFKKPLSDGSIWTKPGIDFVHITLSQTPWHYTGDGLWLYARIAHPALKPRSTCETYYVCDRQSDVLIKLDWEWIALIDRNAFHQTMKSLEV